MLVNDDPADPGLRAAIEAARPELIFSFYFRSMLPMEILSAAPRGAFNMHGSLLPRYRGRAPTNWAVLHDERETGATLHEMVARPDAGRIVDQQAVPILPDDTAREVFDKVTVAAELVLWRSLPAILAGTIAWRPNDLGRGSYFGARRPEDGRLDWSRPAREVYALIRAVAPPYPGAFTEIAGARLVVGAARMAPAAAASSLKRSPGLQIVDGRILAMCGDGGVIDIRELSANGAPLAAESLRALLDAQQREGSSQ